ncbi:MAG: hypothetical protein GY719_38640 [bacterium]|nr:hypothetical protein [bacterium]
MKPKLLVPLSVTLALLSATPRVEAGLADIVAEPIFTGLENPVWVTHDSNGTLMVTLLPGLVVRQVGGGLSGDPVLDIQDRVRGGSGLSSVAFHPSEPWLFAHYAEADGGDMVISRFELTGDPQQASVASEVVLVRGPKAFPLHYGGQIAFGPEGYLWVSTGDGTIPGVGPDPACAAQATDSLEGKILRLDVDSNSDTPPYYAVPPGNPFTGGAEPSVWGYGLRNPWRFSFDRETGDLWVSDVGADQREEVTVLEAGTGAGTNFGWKMMEGTRCSTNLSGCDGVPPCGDPSLQLPLFEYTNTGARCAVIGGFVYRGRLIPALHGRYVYADHCSGEIWAAVDDGGVTTQILPVLQPGLSSFGEDAEGELWTTALDGGVYRLADTTLPDAGLVELERRSIEAREDDGVVEVAVVRVGGTVGQVRVRATPAGTSAVGGVDFVADPAELVWEDGEDGLRTFQIPLIDDAMVEGVEEIEISLELLAGAAVLGARDRGSVSLADDDGCTADATHLCLNAGRFSVSVSWRTVADLEGDGQAVVLGADAGMFWFFSANNPEIFVKVLDACDITGFNNFWVFIAGLTDVQTSLRVLDTQTGEERVYDRPLGVPYVAVQDTDAFDTCP